MPQTTTMTVRLKGPLSDFVGANVGETALTTTSASTSGT